MVNEPNLGVPVPPPVTTFSQLQPLENILSPTLEFVPAGVPPILPAHADGKRIDLDRSTDDTLINSAVVMAPRAVLMYTSATGVVSEVSPGSKTWEISDGLDLNNFINKTGPDEITRYNFNRKRSPGNSQYFDTKSVTPLRSNQTKTLHQLSDQLSLTAAGDEMIIRGKGDQIAWRMVSSCNGGGSKGDSGANCHRKCPKSLSSYDCVAKCGKASAFHLCEVEIIKSRTYSQIKEKKVLISLRGEHVPSTTQPVGVSLNKLSPDQEAIVSVKGLILQGLMPSNINSSMNRDVMQTISNTSQVMTPASVANSRYIFTPRKVGKLKGYVNSQQKISNNGGAGNGDLQLANDLIEKVKTKGKVLYYQQLTLTSGTCVFYDEKLIETLKTARLLSTDSQWGTVHSSKCQLYWSSLMAQLPSGFSYPSIVWISPRENADIIQTALRAAAMTISCDEPGCDHHYIEIVKMVDGVMTYQKRRCCLVFDRLPPICVDKHWPSINAINRLGREMDTSRRTFVTSSSIVASSAAASSAASSSAISAIASFPNVRGTDDVRVFVKVGNTLLDFGDETGEFANFFSPLDVNDPPDIAVAAAALPYLTIDKFHGFRAFTVALKGRGITGEVEILLQSAFRIWSRSYTMAKSLALKTCLVKLVITLCQQPLVVKTTASSAEFAHATRGVVSQAVATDVDIAASTPAMTTKQVDSFLRYYLTYWYLNPYIQQSWTDEHTKDLAIGTVLSSNACEETHSSWGRRFNRRANPSGRRVISDITGETLNGDASTNYLLDKRLQYQQHLSDKSMKDDDVDGRVSEMRAIYSFLTDLQTAPSQTAFKARCVVVEDTTKGVYYVSKDIKDCNIHRHPQEPPTTSRVSHARSFSNHPGITEMITTLAYSGDFAFKRQGENLYTVNIETERCDCKSSHYWSPICARGGCKHYCRCLIFIAFEALKNAADTSAYIHELFSKLKSFCVHRERGRKKALKIKAFGKARDVNELLAAIDSFGSYPTPGTLQYVDEPEIDTIIPDSFYSVSIVDTSTLVDVTFCNGSTSSELHVMMGGRGLMSDSQVLAVFDTTVDIDLPISGIKISQSGALLLEGDTSLRFDLVRRGTNR